MARAPELYADGNFGIDTEIYTDSVTVRIPLRTTSGARPGPDSAEIHVEYQTCTDRYCLPPRTDTLFQPVDVATTALVHAAESFAEDSIAVAAPDSPASTDKVPTTVGSSRAVLPFLLTAFGVGLLSLLTPCVLPMIPLTVGYFHRETARSASRVGASLAHAIGIAGGFIIIGVAVSGFFGASGVVRLAANPWVNVLIAAMFGLFALNLLGIFEMKVPRLLLNRVSRSQISEQVRPLPAAMMGLAFAITSFTCTAPFVGTLLVLASQGNWFWPMMGLTSYAIAFALPFFLLAMSPRLLAALPRTGSWMLTLKACVAVVELALAVKFLSNADMVMHWRLLSREVVICLWIVSALVVALFIAGILVHPHNTRGRPTGRRLALAIAPVVVAIWLAGGLKGRSLGELEAYLPVENIARVAGDDLPWALNDYEGSLVRASTDQRFVFVDFTGYTCTNCRWMEANMFPRPEIKSLLERFVRLRLFTDGRGEPYLRQQALQQERFGTVALPYYAILDHTGRPVATYLGMTRDVGEFAQFLSTPFAR